MAPMNPLQVQLFTGMAAGRRARFEQSPITFGRSPDNVLVIEDTAVSRLHGEIRFEAGQWQLYNHSGNGTKLNRKTVKDKPRPITDGDEVSVGKQLLFSIHVEAVEANAGDADKPLVPAAGPVPVNLSGRPGAQADGQNAEVSSKKRSKLFIAIGVYSALLLGLIIFLGTLGKKPVANGKEIPELSPAEIASIIRAPKQAQPVDEGEYKRSMDDANRLFDRRDIAVGNRFRCYSAYQTAISFAGLGRDTFEEKDIDSQRRYFTVQDELVENVTTSYQLACAKLNRGDYEGAIYGLEDVQARFNDTTTKLYKNVQAKRNAASVAYGKRKLKRKK